LQEKARLLAEQNQEVERKNREVELAKKALEEKAEQLALTSRYKSEFLANMSHELRTPLNSLLILAQMLAENPEGKLTPKQVKFAQTIHQSGMELLSLINDILDLSKIESGMMGVELEQVFLADVQDHISRTFRHVAEEKGLELNLEIAPDTPKTIYTDPRRLQQVMKNLVSNAIKFTEKGSVTLKMERAASGWSGDNEGLNNADSVIAFHVIDTGIGIPEEQQNVIFEPFRQADGATSRQYGGTGLGLSISGELARLLGGEIRLTSKVGEGSTFSLYLPANYVAPATTTLPRKLAAAAPASPSHAAEPQAPGAQVKQAATPPPLERASSRPSRLEETPDTPITAASLQPIDVTDDRETITPDDDVLLIVEDDPTFAHILIDLAHERNLKVLYAVNGAKALMLARELTPTAISLDIRLPDMAGWTIIDRLKHDPATRHIPVHVISIDEDRRRGLSLGAASYLEKGIDMQQLIGVFDRIKQSLEKNDRTLLIVEADENQRKRLAELIEAPDVQTEFVSSGSEGLNALRNTRFDCIVVDLNLTDMSGIDFVEQLQEQPQGKEMPVLIYTGEDPPANLEDQISRLAQTGLVRGIRSAERLLEETAVFLHRVEATLPEEKRKMLEQAREKKDTWLAGGKVLLVDDDMRNLFALTSVLERHKLEVLHAESGEQALEQLQRDPDVDLILMDIMMPKMDGYETIRKIRQLPGFRNTPVVALTAKAMKGDREKCIEAGASDYITKPVNLDDLIWMLRAWLPRVSEKV
jgi:signal transduction histidine kinase/CheY-like chemotaxis protein